MADIQSNIKVNIDTSGALEQIKLLQGQISAFHVQMAKGGAQAAAESAKLRQNLINGINATGKFSAQMTTVKTSTEYFTQALEKNKLTMGEYFRYAGGASKSFGKLFKSEFETITKVARERVKDLQTQYIKMGRDANGAMRAIKVRPLMLDMDNLATKTAIAAQKQQLLNQLLKQGSTNLLNFGKNTQWAGRQLMVGFTVPLMMFSSVAIKSFKEIEEATVKFKRVYGDLSTNNAETDKMAASIRNLAESFTQYGVAVKDTLDMAATAAATGKMGQDLIAQVNAATKLSVLGGVDQQKALETTISLTNTFGLSADQLAEKINFLNAVENQTVLSIEDLTTAIPKAAPVVKQLGGNVEDLAFFLTAMKEGGINASQGANALKSSLASLINPTNAASKMLQGFGINIRGIVNADKGNLKKTVIDFAKALDTLDPLNRARAIEQLFGKFQFARISTLLKNVVDENSQAAKALGLAGATKEELAIVSQREMKRISDSPLYKYQKAMKDFQNSLAPVGEQFLKALTPIINFVNDLLKRFNGLGDGTKNIVITITTAIAGIGPILLMTFGLIANGIANLIKLFANFKSFFNNLGKGSKDLATSTKYMTSEQIEAASIAASLDQVHGKLTQTFTSEAKAIQLLVAEYQKAITAQEIFRGTAMPAGAMPRRFASGGIISGPGSGTSDSILAKVSNGEAIIPAKSVARYPGLIYQLVSGNVPGFSQGTEGLNTSGQGYRVARGHLMEDIKFGSLMHQEIIAKTAFASIYAQFGQYMTVVSNLVAEMPHKLNILLQEKLMKDGTRRAIGATPQQFSKMWNERQGKLLLSAGLGGYNINNPQALKYSMELEKAIHDRAIAIAQGTERQRIDDPILAKATRQVIDETILAGGELKQFATSLDLASKQVGQVRMNLPTSVLKQGLASGQFVADGKNVLFNGQNVGRLRSTGGFRPANPIKPSGSYNVAALRSLAEADAEVYLQTLRSILNNPANDPFVQTRDRHSPHRLAAPDGIQDGEAYNQARLSTIPGLKTMMGEEFDLTGRALRTQLVRNAVLEGGAYNGTRIKRLEEWFDFDFEANLAHSQARMEQELAAGEREGLAHKEGRVQAAATENAEVLAIREEGIVAELGLEEKVYATRRERIAAEKAAALEAVQAERAARRTLLKEKLGLSGGVGGKYAGMQKASMGLMMASMAGSMAGGQIGEISQQLMMPLMMMSMITGPISAVVVALGILAFGVYKVYEAYQEQIKKTLELTEAMGTSNKAMENFASYAKKATPTEIMNLRRENQFSLFQNATGKTTYGQSFLKSDEGKKMLDSVGKSLAEFGTKQTSSLISTQLGEAVISGIFSREQALSIADNIGRQLKDYNLSMNVNAKLMELLGPTGTDITKQPLEIRIKARMNFINEQTKTTSSSLQSIDKAYASDVVSAMNQADANVSNMPFGGDLLWIPQTIMNIFTNPGKKAASYVGIVSNNIQLIQQQMDAFSIDVENAITDAKNNNQQKRLGVLLKLQKDTMNDFSTQMQQNLNLLLDSVDKGNVSASSVIDAQKTAIDNAYKGTAQETQAGAVKDMLYGSNLTDQQKIILGQSLSNKSFDLSAFQQYFNAFSENSDMMSRLSSITKKYGGTLSSQMATATGNMSTTAAEKFTQSVNNVGSYSGANDLVSGILAANQASAVGGPNASKTIENFYATHINQLRIFNKELNDLKNSKVIDFTVIGKIYGSKEMKDMKTDAEYFTSLDKNNRITYTQTFDTYYNMLGNPEFEAQYRSWLNGDGAGWLAKNPKYAQDTHTGYIVWLARQATEAQKALDALNTSGDNAGGEPKASFLDAFVQQIRDVRDASQGLTTGFAASYKAIKDFLNGSKNIFKGIGPQLFNMGLDSGLIKMILGAAPEDIKEIFDKNGNIIIDKVKQISSAYNQLFSENSDTAIVNKLIAMSPTERIQERIDLYQTGLDLLKGKEDKINKTYDDRIKSLDEIQTLNDTINQQQQDNLDIAEALSKGDVSGAAKAAYQARQNAAKQALEQTKRSLEQARQADLNALTISVNGKKMNRVQIEQTIANLTTTITTNKFNQLQHENNILTALENQVTQQRILNSITPKSNDNKSNNDKPYKYNPYTGKLEQQVDIQAATGGHIVGAGTGTSDSIPAMLSNGEYVIRANAVKTIGTDVLDRLNQADKQRYASGGLVGYDDGGYINRDNPEYWDARRRYIMHPGEYLWMLAERFLPYQPAGTTLNDFAQQIINSNSHVNSGNPSLLSIGEHVFIPGISYPGKYGEPLKPSKIKKPIFMPWGTNFNISESHVGQGGGGIGGGLFGFGPRLYAAGGLVGYKDGGKPKPPKPPKNDPGGWDENGIWHPTSYWNQVEKETRRRKWQAAMDKKLGNPSGDDIMDVARNMSYFYPLIGNIQFGKDALNDFSKGNIGGGLLNSAFALLPGTKLGKMVAESKPIAPITNFAKNAFGSTMGFLGNMFKGAKNFIGTQLGVRGGKNALRALGEFADRAWDAASHTMLRGTMGIANAAARLTPRIAFNISDEALMKFINDNLYRNLRSGARSSTSDTIDKRIAVELETMGIAPNAKPGKTPAYGYLTTKEDVPSYYNSTLGGRSPVAPGQDAIAYFNQLINPESRYLGRYGSNAIVLKSSALRKATFSFGDTLSIWDKATRFGMSAPRVDKFSSISSSFPFLSNKLKSTQELMRKSQRNIKEPTSFPYIEAHLPGGFTLKDVESIRILPSGRFLAYQKEDMLKDMDVRATQLRQVLDALGYKNIKIDVNSGRKIADRIEADYIKAHPNATPNEIFENVKYPLPQKSQKNKGLSFMDIVRGVRLAPKGTGINKTSGAKALSNPNISLFLKNLFGKNVHGGWSAKNVNGKWKHVPFDIGKRPPKPVDMDPENWNQNWFNAEFFSSSSKKLGMTYGNLFRMRMPWLTPLNMKILDLYPGAKSVAEQFPELYAQYPHIFDKIENGATLEELLNPTRHLDVAKGLATNPDYLQAIKDAGIGAIRHQSGHGNQAQTDAKNIFAEVFAFLDPSAGMKAVPMPLANIYQTQKNLYTMMGKNNYLRNLGRIFIRPFKVANYKISTFFKDMFKKKNVYENDDIPFLPDVQGSTGGLLKNGKFHYASGGLVIPRFKTGGYVGMMPKFADGGLANLHAGEYVIQKSAVDRVGLNKLNNINEGTTDMGDCVYNYNIEINVKSEANANQIADTVIRQIKSYNNQTLRGVKI